MLVRLLLAIMVILLKKSLQQLYYRDKSLSLASIYSETCFGYAVIWLSPLPDAQRTVVA